MSVDIVAERLFSWRAPLEDPLALALAGSAAGVIALAPLLIAVAGRGPGGGELWKRWGTWVVIALIVLPSVLLGAVTTTLLILAVVLVCYREYAVATGLFREPAISLVIIVCAIAMAFGALDNRFALCTAVPITGAVAIAIVALGRDQPKGYLQRVALGILGLVLVVAGPTYLSMLTADFRARSMILMLMLAVALSDVSAFVVGKTFKGPKLCPRTSPNKSISGAAGAFVITAAFVASVGAVLFRGSAMGGVGPLIGLGVGVAAAAQLGDLVLSAVKRDVGLKDFGAILPGHGGMLDRVDSLVLSPPVLFYIVAYFDEVGRGMPERIFTGA